MCHVNGRPIESCALPNDYALRSDRVMRESPCRPRRFEPDIPRGPDLPEPPRKYRVAVCTVQAIVGDKGPVT